MRLLFMIILICLGCLTSQAGFIGFGTESLIDFKSFDELFAYEYQPNYIIDGYIDVGPYSYDVFADYTMQERKVVYQVCEKHLPWRYTADQEQWERTMYMYQFVVKPYPFPYSEYKPIPAPGVILLCGIGIIGIGMLKRRGWGKR